MRMQPYLGGVITGYIMIQFKNHKLIINNFFVVIYWTLTSITILITLFATYFKDVPLVYFAITFSVGRVFLAIIWGSIVMMCHFGYGGILNRILSSSILMHINKLAYLIFLLNPFVITVLKAGRETISHFDMSSIVSYIKYCK